MKNKYQWRSIIIVVVLAGLLLASCQRETPVDEHPAEQKKLNGTGEEQGDQNTPEQTVMGEVTLYLPNEMADGFLTSSMILEDTPEAILAQLAAEGAIPEGIQMLRFDQENGMLDLSKEYAEGLQVAGTAGEQLMIGCVVNTFLEHYGLDSLLLYSDGKVIETGHNTYEEAFRFIELE